MSLPSSQPPCVAGEFELAIDAWGRLVLIDLQGMRHEGVEPVRAFPLSDPRRWVAICDAEGAELAFIEDLDGLPDQVRETLDEALGAVRLRAGRPAHPEVSAEVEPSEWEVQTDRGLTRFLLTADDGVRRLGAFEAMLVDTHGTRYLIADFRRLDAHSRRILDRFL